ncbi:hypothetical protein E2562_026503 [Oryza meyeriana var. granulata]|uniref:Dolichol-phosphate mannosyltransferase subunit 3 n=1 Tax=Oryza meyeriana var. granulata TaxID=110450 RepID=A0A6G1DMN5_9ORYZ|nr:hypothetical protein E2562_026503 [Oryza meyeriana var. granulata]
MATTSLRNRFEELQLPIYLVVALGCYGLFMVGFGLMFFPTCPQEAVLLQQGGGLGIGSRRERRQEK